jgi:arginine exporter protein ArgO
LPILVFAAIFAALGVSGSKADYLRTAILSAGVFLGSALWAPILIAVLRFFQPNFDFSQRLWVNRISGAIIAAFGVVLEAINVSM